MKKTILCIFLFLLLTSCANQPNSLTSDAPGFFMGLLHGYFSIFAFILGFFTDVRIYNFPNNGCWYDFGFLLGIFAFIDNSQFLISLTKQ